MYCRFRVSGYFLRLSKTCHAFIHSKSIILLFKFFLNNSTVDRKPKLSWKLKLFGNGLCPIFMLSDAGKQWWRPKWNLKHLNKVLGR